MVYTGTRAWEPTLGIDKKGNIFYQAYNDGTEPIVLVSSDGGGSWNDLSPHTHRLTLDPLLYLDYATGRVFTIDLYLACSIMSYSDDQGETWITNPRPCSRVYNDHHSVFSGPPVTSSTVGYENIVYYCWNDIATSSCNKSLDGGLTFTPTGTPAFLGVNPSADPPRCGGLHGHGVVDDEGTVYLPRGWCGQPYLAISEDEGATWERIQVADNGMPLSPGEVTRPGGVSSPFEHEAAVAVDAEGNIYYFWTARDRLPYLAVSTDKGQTFSKPMMIGPPGLKEAWGSTIAVGDTGKIAVAYIGSTNAPGGKSPDGEGPEYDNATWSGYITTSIDALSAKPRFFTASVNPASHPIVRGECAVGRCGPVGDFIDVVIGPDGTPWAAMVDGCPPPANTCGGILGSGFVGTVVGGPKLR